jgi:Tfp pilus assembly protein PilF
MEERLEAAAQLFLSGDHAAAESIYNTVLQSNPNDLTARLKRAHVRSWQGHHDLAQDDFQTILKVHPKNVDALVGLGYSLAWSEKYDRAESRFQDALKIDPSRIDAHKGSAFTALWRGDADEAIRRFQRITRLAPDEPEAFVGLGNALSSVGDSARAIEAFRRALVLEPERRDALEALDAIKTQEVSMGIPIVWEFSVWGGSTSNGGGTGLRTIEIAAWPTRDLRFWVRYDNALSLDNPALVRDGIEIPSLYLGGLVNWGAIYTTRLEVGRRELLNNVEQQLFLLEQVVYLPGTTSLKAGGFLGRRDDGRTADLNVYAGLGFPLGSSFRIDPTFFFTKTGGVAETEWRLLLPVEYHSKKGYRLGINLASGKISSVIRGASGSVWSAATIISFPLHVATEGHLLVRQESGPAMGQFTSISVGLTHQFNWR